MSEPTVHVEHKRLENSLVSLEIFDPKYHGPRFLQMINADREDLKYTSFPNLDPNIDFDKDFYSETIAAVPGNYWFAVFDKTTAGTGPSDDPLANYAGCISLNETDFKNAVSEVGILIFPAFQRTHVTRNAIGLLLLWAMDPPSMGGLGLRRVKWHCHSENTASRKAASRMGFEFEGIIRWGHVVPEAEKIGLSAEALQKRNGTEKELPGRHTATYSIVWVEWDDKREKIVALMDKK